MEDSRLEAVPVAATSKTQEPETGKNMEKPW